MQEMFLRVVIRVFSLLERGVDPPVIYLAVTLCTHMFLHFGASHTPCEGSYNIRTSALDEHA